MPRRIPFSAAKIVLRKVAAGYSNEDINKALVAAGYRTVGDQTFNTYRKSDYVRDALVAGSRQAVQVGVLERNRRLLFLNGVAMEIFRRLQGRFVDGGEAFPEAVKIDDILTATKALMPILAEIRTLQKPYYDAEDAVTYPAMAQSGVEQLRAMAQQSMPVSQGIIYAMIVDTLKSFVEENGFGAEEDTSIVVDAEVVEVDAKQIEGER